MPIAFAVALGGGLGAVARWFLSVRLAPVFGAEQAWSIMIVNIIGSFLAGICAEAFLSLNFPGNGPTLRAFVLPGLLGGFTTFSAFSLDSLRFLERGDFGAAAFHMLGSLGLALLAVISGVAVVRLFVPAA